MLVGSVNMKNEGLFKKALKKGAAVVSGHDHHTFFRGDAYKGFCGDGVAKSGHIIDR